MSKVHASSHEIKNAPYVSANYENTTTTVTGDLTTNYNVEKNTSFAEKIKNVGEHFKSGANDCKLDKDTDRSNLNSKVKYLSLAPCCTSDGECWFALGMELYVLRGRHDQYS